MRYARDRPGLHRKLFAKVVRACAILRGVLKVIFLSGRLVGVAEGMADFGSTPPCILLSLLSACRMLDTFSAFALWNSMGALRTHGAPAGLADAEVLKRPRKSPNPA